MATSSMHAPPGRTFEFRVGDVFGRSFEVFTRHFILFFVLTLVPSVPLLVLPFIPPEAFASTFVIGLAGFLLVFVCGMLASAAVTYGVVQDLRGRPFTFSESLAVALRRLLPLLGVSFCFGFMAMLGMILLVIPAFIVMCVYYIAPQACVVERKGVFASLSRSAALTKGHRWRILGIVIVLMLVNIAVGYVLGLVLAGLSTLAALVTGAWQVLAGAFSAVLGAVLYFQLRSVKEGFELDQIVSVFD